MLQVIIKDINKDEVIFDKEVCAIAVQAVGREKTTRIRHTSEDAEWNDVVLCTKALIQEAAEAKKICSNVIEQVLDKFIPDELD